jgi:hypothetical protein
MRLTLLFSLILMGAAPRALAQNDISFVSNRSGLDSNPCTLQLPCFSFGQAQYVTNIGGTIKALDAGYYRGFQLAKSLTIDGCGLATILALFGDTFGIVVTASTGGNVVIRDVLIQVDPDADPLATAIMIQANTHLENVSVTGFANYGVKVDNGVVLTAKNLVVSGDPTNGVAGIWVTGGSASLRDSVVTGWQVGFQSNDSPLPVIIERSEISFNGTGVRVQTAVICISDSVITGNTTGIQTSGGQIITFRSNMLAGNTADGSTPFSISLK